MDPRNKSEDDCRGGGRAENQSPVHAEPDSSAGGGGVSFTAPLDLIGHRSLYPRLGGRLAQLVEHSVHIAGVTGSSPVSPTIDLSRGCSSLRSGLRRGGLTGRRAVALASPSGSGRFLHISRLFLAALGPPMGRPMMAGARSRLRALRARVGGASPAPLVSFDRIQACRSGSGAQVALCRLTNRRHRGVWLSSRKTKATDSTSEIGFETKSHRNVPTSLRAPIMARR